MAELHNIWVHMHKGRTTQYMGTHTSGQDYIDKGRTIHSMGNVTLWQNYTMYRYIRIRAELHTPCVTYYSRTTQYMGSYA